ncbi:MAG TPA: hypothetical protein VKE50_09335, partial [Thermoanaerobaculia bacterium]|nr:hypothetical protein [Thermoanaerobaculia bacterium]
MTLCPIARAAEIRFAADVPVAVAARQRALADEVWPAWERRLGIEVPRPSLVVALALPEAMAADF